MHEIASNADKTGQVDSGWANVDKGDWQKCRETHGEREPGANVHVLCRLDGSKSTSRPSVEICVMRVERRCSGGFAQHRQIVGQP